MPNTCSSCGGALDPSLELCPRCDLTATLSWAGDVSGDAEAAYPSIPGYRIVRRLGEGGMGTVFVAEETALGRRVAIKVISRHVSTDPQAKARFMREARTLATIEHPHVVRVYSFGEVDGLPYLVMEFVEGETLEDRIDRVGKLPVEEAIRITRDVVDALDAAWERQIIHRDIKPSNILIDRRNRVRVVDFGLAKPKQSTGDASLTMSGYMVGTPLYVSPEQAQDKDVDFRSDFYSLGVTLFHMIAGVPPFDGNTPIAIVARHLNEPMPLLRARRDDTPPQIERLTQWITAKDPAQRPISHGQLLAALDAMIAGTTPPIPSLPSLSTERWWRGRQMRMLAIVASVIVVAAAAIFIAARPTAGETTAASDHSKFVVAVTPFYGPDPDSVKEGRIMASMVEGAIAKNLGSDQARVLGIEQTGTPVRSDEAARELGTRLGANAVVWGDAFALRQQTEIQPHLTVIRTAKRESRDEPKLMSAGAAGDLDALFSSAGGAVRLLPDVADQIALRRTSADGIGQLVVFVAAIHALETDRNPAKALALFEQLPSSPDALRYRVQALLDMKRVDDARALLVAAIEREPSHAPSHAILGDLDLVAGRMTDAIASHRRAAMLATPYTTSHAIFYDGKLYVKERYRGHTGAEGSTLYLIGIDPQSHRVIERRMMSGPIKALRVEDGSLVITSQSRGGETWETRLRNGRFDRPTWLTPPFQGRHQAVRAGSAMAINFTDHVTNAFLREEAESRFALKKRSNSAPATLVDLERAARAAGERDPTQPWHLFFLALSLRAQNRGGEADAVFEELLRRDYAEVPYHEFTWMQRLMEGYGDFATGARLYAKALAKRKAMPQPVSFASWDDRVVNAPFVESTRHRADLDHRYEALTRGRALIGISTDGEDLVAAAWSRYFAKRGEGPRAKREADVVRRARENPFNEYASAAKSDYALTLAAAFVVAFAFLLVQVLVSAAGRARRVMPRADWKQVMAWIATRPRWLIIAAGSAIAGAMLFLMARLFIESPIAVACVALALAAAVLIARSASVSPATVFAFVTHRERRALVAGYVALLIASLVFLDFVASNVGFDRLYGLGDTIGHPRVVGRLEETLARRGDGDRALRYVAAVANQYAGNSARAESLYGSLQADEKVTANLKALGEQRLPAVPLTADEIYAGLRGSRSERWRELRDLREWLTPVPFLIALAPLMALLPLLPFLLIASRAGTLEPEESKRTRLAMLIVPGFYDIRRGSTWRAAVILVLLASIVVPLGTMIAYGERVAVGPMTALTAQFLGIDFPLPSLAEDPVADLQMTLILAYPWAKTFVLVLVTSFAAALALHLVRIPRILRQPVAVAPKTVPETLQVDVP